MRVLLRAYHARSLTPTSKPQLTTPPMHRYEVCTSFLPPYPPPALPLCSPRHFWQCSPRGKSVASIAGVDATRIRTRRPRAHAYTRAHTNKGFGGLSHDGSAGSFARAPHVLLPRAHLVRKETKRGKRPDDRIAHTHTLPAVTLAAALTQLVHKRQETRVVLHPYAAR